MKKIIFKIRKGTKELILGLAVLGVLGLSAFTHTATKAIEALAPVGIVATMKKKGVTLTEDEEKSFGAIDEVIANHVKGLVTNEDLTEKLKGITSGMTADQVKEFNEMVETVQKQAILLDQIKSMSNGSGGVDDSIMGQIRAGLKAAMPEILKFKAQEKGAGFQIAIKAAGPQTIGATTASTTAATAIAFPTPEVIPGLNDLHRNQPFLIQIMSVSGTSSSNIIWQEKINPQGQAQWVGENVLAPMVSFDIEIGESRAKMVTAQTTVSTQMLDDIDYISGEIEKEIIYQINILTDAYLLSGNGAGDNLKGLAAYVGGYVLTTVKTDNPNTSDVILAACTQITSLNFRANIACLNPIDFANTKLLKGTTGYYIINPNDKDNSMGGVPVIQSNQVPVGKVLVMDTTRTNVKILQGMMINFGWVNDNFTKHMVTIMGDMRLHNYIKNNDLGAFVYDDIANIKSAIANV